MAPRITDWRSMVDSVLIVSGRYDVRVGTARVTVALKITDMLGEELLVTREV